MIIEVMNTFAHYAKLIDIAASTASDLREITSVGMTGTHIAVGYDNGEFGLWIKITANRNHEIMITSFDRYRNGTILNIMSNDSPIDETSVPGLLKEVILS